MEIKLLIFLKLKIIRKTQIASVNSIEKLYSKILRPVGNYFWN